MNVLLKPELEKFIADKVKAGQYPNVDAIVNQALEVLEEFDPEHETYLRKELQRGLEQLDRGERSDFAAETIITEERRRLKDGERSH
jgi:antitoxin ParD1/3/4